MSVCFPPSAKDLNLVASLISETYLYLYCKGNKTLLGQNASLAFKLVLYIYLGYLKDYNDILIYVRGRTFSYISHSFWLNEYTGIENTFIVLISLKQIVFVNSQSAVL